MAYSPLLQSMSLCLFMVLGDTSMKLEDELMDLPLQILHILSIPPAWWMAPINQASPLVPH